MQKLKQKALELQSVEPRPNCCLCKQEAGRTIACHFDQNEVDPFTLTDEELEQSVEWVWFCTTCLMDYGGLSGCAEFYTYKQGLH